jgi:hypothetical protein
MKLKVSYEVERSEGSAIFDLDDLNCESESEWSALSDQEQQERIQTALDEMPTQPYYFPVKWEKRG